MENRKVWVFYALLGALWLFGFGASLIRYGEASRRQAPASYATAPLATRN